MAVAVTSQNVFFNITKGEKSLNSTNVYKETIRGPSKTSFNIEDTVIFAKKNKQLPAVNLFNMLSTF